MTVMPADKCRVPLAFWRALERADLRPSVVLRRAGLPATLHLSPQILVTTKQFFALWKALEELSDDSALAFRLVQDTETSVHPPSSLAAFFARDYRDALFRLARFKRLCTPEKLIIEEKDAEVVITVKWLHADEPVPAIAADVDFASLVELGRRGTGKHITPLQVEFERADPKSDVHRAFFGCPVIFGAPQNRLVLNRKDLDRPFPGHNPEMLEMLTPALASSLGEHLARSTVREQVKLVLKRSLASGRPELSDIANDLGMSERTLQRRITEEGATFRDLLIEARQELGRNLLSNSSVGIEEVACLLGYQDTSSFYRAFKEWEGVSPSRWRDSNIPEDQV